MDSGWEQRMIEVRDIPESVNGITVEKSHLELIFGQGFDTESIELIIFENEIGTATILFKYGIDAKKKLEELGTNSLKIGDSVMKFFLFSNMSLNYRNGSLDRISKWLPKSLEIPLIKTEVNGNLPVQEKNIDMKNERTQSPVQLKNEYNDSDSDSETSSGEEELPELEFSDDDVPLTKFFKIEEVMVPPELQNVKSEHVVNLDENISRIPRKYECEDELMVQSQSQTPTSAITANLKHEPELPHSIDAAPKLASPKPKLSAPPQKKKFDLVGDILNQIDKNTMSLPRIAKKPQVIKLTDQELVRNFKVLNPVIAINMNASDAYNARVKLKTELRQKGYPDPEIDNIIITAANKTQDLKRKRLTASKGRAERLERRNQRKLAKENSKRKFVQPPLFPPPRVNLLNRFRVLNPVTAAQMSKKSRKQAMKMAESDMGCMGLPKAQIRSILTHARTELQNLNNSRERQTQANKNQRTKNQQMASTKVDNIRQWEGTLTRAGLTAIEFFNMSKKRRRLFCRVNNIVDLKMEDYIKGQRTAAGI